MKIGILGAGGWGTALARLLTNNGHQVSLWSWQPDHVAEMLAERENSRFLPGVILPEQLSLTASMPEALSGAQLVVLAVPSSACEETARQALPFVPKGAILLSVAKGFVSKSWKRISQVLEEIYPDHAVAVLSGPSHAEEVGWDKPTLVCVAGKDNQVLSLIQETFISPKFRVYTNKDIIGVEIAGAVKNVIALGCGILDGMEQGDNAKAALMTRGLAEMERLGVKMGANPQTFRGLSAVGDLIVTCTSCHSRNYRAGRRIGQGESWRQILQGTEMVVEGVYATEGTYALSQQYQVYMPITQQLYGILYHDCPLEKAMDELMTRIPTAELND